jgi:hypothetical protein
MDDVQCHGPQRMFLELPRVEPVVIGFRSKQLHQCARYAPSVGEAAQALTPLAGSLDHPHALREAGHDRLATADSRLVWTLMA